MRHAWRGKIATQAASISVGISPFGVIAGRLWQDTSIKTINGSRRTRFMSNF